MKFIRDLFNDNNDINEKAIIGIISFLIMIIYSGVDVAYALMGKVVEINERIYSSFETIVLGAFLISSGEKIAKIINNGKDNRSKKSNVRFKKERQVEEAPWPERQDNF